MAGTLSVTEAVDKFVNNIKKKYKGRRIIQEDQLLGCKLEKLVRLELVKKKRLQASEQRGNKYGSEVRLDLDWLELFRLELEKQLQASEQRGNKYGSEDSSVTRTPLAYADLFKVEKGKKEIKTILIDGDAGIGKTTFCIAVCEDWANGKIFQEFELVLLLPLREQEVASAGSLLDLLKFLHSSPEVCDSVKNYFEDNEESILIIADGWDELGNEKRDKGTFLYKLLFGSQYSSVSVIVTSRPSASASLHYGKRCIDRFAEIHGFDKEHIVEYIRSEFEDDQTVATDILDKLESNPLVENICSIPLNCAIICHLWQVLKEDFPTTMTGLYTKVILNIILRSIHKFPTYENIVSFSSFDDLPETLQQSWWLLCEFAFHTLKKDKLIFSDKELRDFFPQGLSLDDIHCFGLLQSSVSMLEVGCGRSFHFLHKTFQEYLAALFLVKQKSCEVAVADSDLLISGLTNLFKVPMKYDYPVIEDSIVLRFFFGIAYTFENFQNSISQRILTSLTGLDDRSLPRDRVLCYWAFEAHNDQFVRVVIDKLEGSYTLPRAVHDFVAVAYVIAKTPECTDEAISLYGYGLQDYHFIMLTDILSDKDGKLQVENLELGSNNLTDRGMAGLFSRAAAAFRSLCYLALDNLDLSNINMIDDECINPILATLDQSLNEVAFSFKNNELDVPSLKVFRDALCHHQLSNLTELCLNGSLSSDPLANAEFIQALGHYRGLKVLDLPSNNLCAPGGRALGKILPPFSLERLDISYAKLGDEGISAFIQGLESTCHIGWLYLGNNDIHAAGILCLTNSIYAGKMVIKDSLHLTENPLDLEGAEAVVRLLSNEYFLAEDVYLSFCELTTAEGDSAHSISPHSGESSMTCVGFREWICENEIKADGVEILRLRYSKFSGEGIHVLAGFMHLCPQLRSLDCIDCNITSNDLKQLLSLLSQSNLNLKWWDLGGNNLDDDGVSALIEHFPMFPSLTNIDIRRNSQISPEMCRNLKEICEKRKGKIAKIDSPMLGPEKGAGTDVNNQCSIPDSVDPTTTEPHPIRQEVQKVETVVAEGRISHGQSEDSSDDERHITPLAAKRVKLQEDESDQSILEARATVEDSGPGHSSSLVSSLSCTTGPGREDRSASVTSEEDVDRLPPTVESGRTATPGPQLGEFVSAIEDITDPYILGENLGIKSCVLEKIERNHPRDVDRQMAEVIKYWLRNSSDYSWEALANAVEKMGGHGNLVKKLKDKHLENTTTTTS